MSCKHGARKGFSLVELVVVILIMGILAAVAAPKMFDKANEARTNGTKQSLATLRDAIELYRAATGEYPASATNLATDLKTYIKGPFPEVQIGDNKGSAGVVAASQSPMTSAVTGGAGWQYDKDSGEIVVNDAALLTW